AIGALPHESIRESSEPVCEAHDRLPHRPGWGNYVTDRVEEFRDGQPLKLEELRDR
ncbi:MAG: hypothetical protein JWR34_2676, partial [Mycobacterium sp.]|nr:hypothetical protein [Mycobacterium sp.]